MDRTNKTELFTLNYPENSGFLKTDIYFHKDKIDLLSIYPPQNGSTLVNRIFVTDTNIASLESMKDFMKTFTVKDKKESMTVCTRGKEILLILGAGEAYKTLDYVLFIVKNALEANFDRNSVFIAIGGGVLCDMTAFASSIFKRGALVEFVPTTLLAMVDASVGGKTGCDYLGFKNMIGSFYPARTLHVWPSFVQFLPENEYRSGLAEAVKTALLFSPEMLELFTSQSEKINEKDEEILDKIITECVKDKARIVEEDFKERGRRAFLNLGHTFGHALEAVAGLGVITHGDAVAWGIGRALDLSFNKGLCTKSFRDETKQMLETLGYDMKGLPDVIKSMNENPSKMLVEAMHKDKKNKAGGKIRLIIQKDVCQTEIIEAEDEEILEVLK